MIPSILKPTRITKPSATIIDNNLTNCDDEMTTAILTDITDPFFSYFDKTKQKM